MNNNELNGIGTELYNAIEQVVVEDSHGKELVTFDNKELFNSMLEQYNKEDTYIYYMVSFKGTYYYLTPNQITGNESTDDEQLTEFIANNLNKKTFK